MIHTTSPASDGYRVFVVDDDPVILALIVRCLNGGGFTVASTNSGAEALDSIIRWRPDCVILDIMMPGVDGLEVCRRLRAMPQLSCMKIVILSGKVYKSDRRHAMTLGADAFITKPLSPKAFVGQVRRIIEDRIHLTFWGVRGTLPVPGPHSVRFGGNTSCVSVEFARGPLLVFDAGTGIKVLSDHLMGRKQPHLEVKVFLSHPHWDHINALPFFAPLYGQGNDIEIFGPCQGRTCVEEYLKGQMDGMYFPITAQEFCARSTYTNLREEVFRIEQAKVRTMLLNHPGHCLGYRVEYRNRAICYITDNELYPEDTGLRDQGYVNKLEAFVHGATALITDTTYMDDEYRRYVNWGHSSVGEVVSLAHRAQVETLYLFHHDPNQNDDAIDAKLALAHAQLDSLGSETKCVAPVEGQLLSI